MSKQWFAKSLHIQDDDPESTHVLADWANQHRLKPGEMIVVSTIFSVGGLGYGDPIMINVMYYAENELT